MCVRERAEHRSPDYRTAFQVPAMLWHDVNHVLASILMFSWSNQNTTGTNANLYTYIHTRRSSLQIFRNRNIFRWSSALLFQLLSCPKSGHFIWWFEIQTFSEDDWIMAQLLSIVEDCIQLLMRKLLLAFFTHRYTLCVQVRYYTKVARHLHTSLIYWYANLWEFRFVRYSHPMSV